MGANKNRRKFTFTGASQAVGLSFSVSCQDKRGGYVVLLRGLLCAAGVLGAGLMRFGGDSFGVSWWAGGCALSGRFWVRGFAGLDARL